MDVVFELLLLGVYGGMRPQICPVSECVVSCSASASTTGHMQFLALRFSFHLSVVI